jgi:hypothetical protein
MTITPTGMTRPYCRHCKHPAHRADCGVDDCGCARYEPRDQAAREKHRRFWLVEVSMFVRNRWVEGPALRVRAGGAGGAAATAIREARRQRLRPRTRVAQTIVKVTTVKGGQRD